MTHILVRIPTMISMHPKTPERTVKSYLGDKPHTIVNDRFRAITLSCNPEPW
jgi:hypothetical protein